MKLGGRVTVLALLLSAPLQASLIEREELQESYLTESNELNDYEVILESRKRSIQKSIKKKSHLFVKLKNSAAGGKFLWQKDNNLPREREKLVKILKLSLRREVVDLKKIEKQLSQIDEQREWIKIQFEQELKILKSQRKSRKVASSFSCQNSPWGGLGENGELIQDFGQREDQETGLLWKSHGWWIRNSGNKVHACNNGEVAYVGQVRGRGNVLIVKHDRRILTVYANLEEHPLKVGQKIKAGQKIAQSLGKLYFELRLNGEASNPRRLFSKNQLKKLGL